MMGTIPAASKRIGAIGAKAAACLLAGALALSALGCSSGSRGTEGGQPKANAEGDAAAASEAFDLSSLDLEFSDRDMDPSYDEAKATHVGLSDAGTEVSGEGAAVEGSTVTVSSGGTYVLKGELSNGSIVVEAGDDDKVQLVFAGASVRNESGPALCVENADKCFLTLAEGTQNSLSDGAAYELSGEDDNRDATVFSRDDLTVNGEGALSVTGNYRHAVCSNDDLRITGGVLDVASKEDAFRGKDCIKIAAGTMTVNAGDDAFHSDAFLYVGGGTIDVQGCYEGYEGEQVIIDGGEHSITASDDALNAALSDSGEGTSADSSTDAPSGQAPTDASPGQAPTDAPSGQAPSSRDGAAFGAPGGMAASSSSCVVQINGGTVSLAAGSDGIDSNGSVEINGGTVLVSGPDNGMDGALDYDIDASVSGGVVLMVGAVGNTSGLDASAQPVALGNVGGSKGQEVSLVGADGAVLATLTASEDFSTVLASAPGVAEGEALRVVVDGNATDVTVGSIASAGAGAMDREGMRSGVNGTPPGPEGRGAGGLGQRGTAPSAA